MVLSTLYALSSHTFFFFFWCGPFLKSLLNLLQYCFCFFYVLVFWPWGMWDLGSRTRDQTRTPYIGRRSLNHWTAREVPILSYLICLPFKTFIKINMFLYKNKSTGKFLERYTQKCLLAQKWLPPGVRNLSSFCLTAFSKIFYKYHLLRYILIWFFLFNAEIH